MVEKDPATSKLSVKMRAQMMSDGSLQNGVIEPGARHRGKGYVGKTQAQQQGAAELGAQHRAKNYVGRTLAQQQGAAELGAQHRAKNYVGKTLAQQAQQQPGSPLTKRDPGYKGKPSSLHPYATNAEFMLNIGDYYIKCSKISNLSVTEELEEVPEGGNNLFPNVFVAAKKKSDTLIFEQAMLEDESLPNLTVGVHVGKGTITIRRDGKKFRSLGFDDGIITKVELTNLDALGKELLIRKVELVHSGLHEVK